MKKNEYKKTIDNNIEAIDVFDAIKDYAYNKKYDKSLNTPPTIKASFSYKKIAITFGCCIFCCFLLLIGSVLYEGGFFQLTNMKSFDFERLGDESTDFQESLPEGPANNTNKEQDKLIVEDYYQKVLDYYRNNSNNSQIGNTSEVLSNNQLYDICLGFYTGSVIVRTSDSVEFNSYKYKSNLINDFYYIYNYLEEIK